MESQYRLAILANRVKSLRAKTARAPSYVNRKALQQAVRHLARNRRADFY